MWLTPVFVVIDCLLAILAAAIAGILITGGGQFSYAAVRVSARSIGNPLIGLVVLAILRFAFSDRAFTFYGRMSRSRIRHGSLAALERARGIFDSLTATRARRWVLIVSLASLAVKLGNIFWYRGFYSGDDVEIHEMTLSILFHRDWPIWNLRSPVFPVGFIFPVQWLLVTLGITGTTALVIAGRIVVALFSTANVLLLFAVTLRQWKSVPIATFAALLLATSGLHVQFGSSELPRTVATTFLLAAVWFLHAREARAAAAAIFAGMLIGLAGAIRFSEIMFLAPAALTFAIERRWRRAVLIVIGGVAAYLGLLIAGDWLYWGSPFHSGKAIVQYTLVDRLSSRGYQGWHYYLSYVLVWTNPFAVLSVLVALFYGGTAARRYGALWVGIPLLLLSMLPHKEPRYLLPLLPFWCALASVGAWEAIARLRPASRSELFAAGFLALFVVGMLVEADRFRFRRSADGVAAMQFVADQQPRAVAFDAAWAGGGRLYLGPVPLMELHLQSPDAAERSLATLCRDNVVDWVALQSREGVERSIGRLESCGFETVSRPQLPSTYVILRRTRPGQV
jgi:hypothetical protein